MANGNIVVKFAITLDDLAGPCVCVGPGEGGKAHRRTVILPVLHIGTGDEVPVLHGVCCRAVLVMTCEDVDTVVIDHWRGVGRVDRLHNRVVGLDDIDNRTEEEQCWREE